ncbi:putative disease resistance RPP13-like protein 1 isoform X3 [Silene latifolia]|uniref:putative disease resistance RPP13-like protein 1 isoform X3 n=1 Tax=Silene latifolia TaxID=37657 RepID=UPI003D7759D1
MDLSKLKGSIIRLKNEQNQYYLVADQDAETVTLNRDGSSKDSCWYVELVDKNPEIIRLKSCVSGKYLCATDIPFNPKKEGKLVIQIYSESQLDMYVIDWFPIKESYDQFIMFKTYTGSLLRSNDCLPQMKCVITHDTPLLLTRLSGFFWTIDVPEMQIEISSPYAFVNQEPIFSKAGGNFSELGDEGNSSVPIQTIKAGPLNRNRWRILELIINFIVKLRLLLKEAYKNQEMMKLHCYLFPSDYVFERETLVQLWMAAGYLRKRRMEEYGRRYFDILLNKGLILPSKNDNIPGKYVTNVGEVANGLNRILKFKDVDLLTVLKEEHMEAKGAKPWHVSLTSNDINQTTFETLKRFNELRTLLFVVNYGSSLRQLPADLFLALPCMEALDLSGSHITELPGSIGKMSQLRYLNLSFTLIESLPETISRLQELQTLNLEGCKRLYYLPRGFKKLINLRHLYFDVLGQLNFMPRGIGALTELRTLSAFIVDVEKGCNIKELRYMNNLIGSCCITGLENVTLQGAKEASLHSKRLSRLQLRWNEYGVKDQLFYMEAASYLEPHPCLEELEMLRYPDSKFPWWICAQKFKQLGSITLRQCKVRRLDIRLGQLPYLKSLNIIEMDTVETIDRSIHAYGNNVSFPKLEKLTIEGMLYLDSWTEVKFGDFPVLAELSIKDCPNLTLLPFIPFLGSLKLLDIGKCTELDSLSDQKLPDKLETLMVHDCPLLIMSYSENGAEWDKIKHVPHIWFDLEEMHSVPGDGTDSSLMREYRLLLSYLTQLLKNGSVSTDRMEDVNARMLREEACFLEYYGLEDEQKMAVSELRKLLDLDDKGAKIFSIEPSQAKITKLLAQAKKDSEILMKSRLDNFAGRFFSKTERISNFGQIGRKDEFKHNQEQKLDVVQDGEDEIRGSTSSGNE